MGELIFNRRYWLLLFVFLGNLKFVSAKSPAYQETHIIGGREVISEYEEGFFDMTEEELKEESELSKKEKELTQQEKKRLEEIKQAKEKLKKAESAAVATVKDLVKLEKEIAELEKSIPEMEKALEGKTAPGVYNIQSERSSIEQQLQHKKEQLKNKEKQEQEMQEKLESQSTEISENYQELAELYEKYNMVGDPVDLSSGDYVCNYNEVIGRRKYKVGENESFGINWTCPLDSRIVRCQGDDLKALSAKYKEILQKCEEALGVAKRFHEEFTEYSHLADLITAYDNYCKVLRNGISQYDSFIKENDVSIELNLYATYGRYSNPQAYYGPPDVLNYVDMEGKTYRCFFDGGCWVPADRSYPGSRFRIYSRDENTGEIIGSSNNKGGFVVVWDSGLTCYYNKYGILDYKIDMHGKGTKYFSEGKYVNKVQLPTGEMLSINRNSSGCIQSINGTVSGSTLFYYTGDNLMYGYTRSDGISFFYEYTEPQCLLHKIIKSDGKFISIDYESDPSNGNKKSVSRITNENGDSEYFLYFPENGGKRIIHTTYDGLTEIYLCNASGKVYYTMNGQGEETYIIYNEQGLITEINENGISRKINYGFDLTPYEIIYSDGSSYTTTYDKGLIVKEVDRDGFSNEYKYNSTLDMTYRGFCGNQISVMEYYSGGLLKKLEENNLTYEYEYNQFGSVTQKTTTGNSILIKEQWTYDEKNRVSRYTSSTGEYVNYSYGEKEIRENHNGEIETVRKFNSRVWEIETVETDLKSGKKHVIQKNYDGRGKVTDILLDGQLFTQYEYTPGGKKKSVIVWNLSDSKNKYGCRTDYVRNDKNQIVSEVVYTVDAQGCPSSQKITKNENIYGRDGNKSVIQKKIQGYNPEKNIYDENKRLIYKSFSDGTYKNYVYSKAGRLLKEETESKRNKEYVYFTDGSSKVIATDGNGFSKNYFYDKNGNITRKTSAEGRFVDYQYDAFGNVILETGTAGSVEYEYDNRQNITAKRIKDNNGQLLYNCSFVHDYRNKKSEVFENGVCSRIEKYDGWGQIIEKEDANGKTFFEYDGTGNVTRERNGDGSVIDYVYTPYGEILSVTVNNSFVRSYEYYPGGQLKAVYDNGNKIAQYQIDSRGKLTGTEDNFGNQKKINYGNRGFAESSESSDSGVTRYFVDESLKQLKVLTSIAGETVYDFDGAGNCISVKNALGKRKTYSYDCDGRIKKKKLYNGKEVFYTYNDAEGIVIKKYQDSEDFIQKNFLGNVIKAKNAEVSYLYDYDQAGRLKKVTEEKTGTYISYEYNDFGLCVRKYNDLFDYEFLYDKAGRLCFVKEGNSGVWGSCEYDDCSRIKYKKFSSGSTLYFTYDEYGRKCGIITKDSTGQIIHGEYLVYDEKNRICCVFNQKGEFVEYEYNSNGRLVTSRIPFSKAVAEKALKEGIDCGLFEEGREFDGTYYKIKQDLLSKARNIAEKCGCNINLMAGEYIWEEKYEYTPTGSIAAVSNPYFQLCYEYNSMNQLISKKGKNSDADGMKFIWSDEGNLLEIRSLYETVSFSYGRYNRPEIIKTSDLRNNSTAENYYTYDVFGRRFSEKTSDGFSHIYLYDALNNNLFADIPILENFQSSASYAAPSGGMQYKYNDEKEYRILNEAEGDYSGESDTEQKYDGRPFSILRIGGTEECFVYMDQSVITGYDADYLVKDFRNNVVSFTDNYSSLLFKSDYDVWGNSEKSGKNINYQFSVNTCSTSIKIYNLGFRDYIPEIKSFTTADPMESGINLYSYCSGDAVNYADSSGFDKISLNKKENALLQAELCKYISYNYHMDRTFDIPDDYDCADVVSYIDAKSKQDCNLENDTPTQEFYDFHQQDNIKAAKDSVNSKDFYENNKFRKTVDGYDNDIYYMQEHKKEIDKDVVDKNEEKRNDFFEKISDPDTLSVGSIIAFKTSEYNKERGYNNAGHVIMITAREFDADGNVIGFSYIEGHQSYNKKTNIGYINLKEHGTADSLESYFGIVDGVYEMENADAEQNCSE